jgi:hypothetical protein
MNNPQIGQYYVNLTQAQCEYDESRARYDFLAAGVVLGMNHKSLLPLAVKLFPGKSLEQILKPKAVNEVRKEVTYNCVHHEKTSHGIVSKNKTTESTSIQELTDQAEKKTLSGSQIEFFPPIHDALKEVQIDNIGKAASELSRTADWTKGKRGIKSFEVRYKPGKVTTSFVMWDPKVWENEQEDKRMEERKSKEKIEEVKRAKKILLNSTQTGQVVWGIPGQITQGCLPSTHEFK